MTYLSWRYAAVALLLAVTIGGCERNDKISEYIDDLPDPTDPFDKRTPSEQQSMRTSAVSSDYTLKHLPSAPNDKCSCSLNSFENSEINSGLDKADVVFMRRVVSTILNHIHETSANNEYMASMTLPSKSLALLTNFVQKDENFVQEASEVLVSSFNLIEPSQPVASTFSSWLLDYQTTITSLLQILMIIAITSVMLSSTMRLWQGLRWRQFLFYVLTVCFLISVPWTWGHLYKQKLAERMHRTDINFKAPPECDPQNFKITNILWWSSSPSKCEKYYQDQIVDPLWEVKPTTALAYTVVEFFWKPLEIMGEPLGKFVREVLEPLPFYLKPVVAILGLLFLWWCLVLLSGMRVWTWFFIVEPAVTAQHQLTAMQSSVDEMRAFINDSAATCTQRERQMGQAINQLTQCAARQDAVSEILPVLHEMCADYGERLNNQRGRANDAYDDVREGWRRAPFKHSPAAGDTATTPAHVKKEEKFGLSSADHLVITTANIDLLTQFYCSIGMTLRTFGNGRQALHFGLSKINLHRVGEEIKPRAKNAASGSIDLCLVCDCHISTTVHHLQHNKIEIELGPVQRTGARGPITSVYTRDPDGNLIELAHYEQAAVHSHVETIHSQ